MTRREKWDAIKAGDKLQSLHTWANGRPLPNIDGDIVVIWRVLLREVQPDAIRAEVLSVSDERAQRLVGKSILIHRDYFVGERGYSVVPDED
jgi:hypothetical protein